MKTLILGLGNPILSDDGVGVFIARRLEGRINGVDITTTALAGLNLLDLVAGYEKVFVIDAMTTGEGPVGRLEKIMNGDGALHLFSSHGLDFFNLLDLGRCLGHKIPEVGGIYGIEIGADISFGRSLSLPLSEKIETITEEIYRDIQAGLNADFFT